MAPAPPHRLSVGEILRPRSVAVFGASESRDKFGGRILYFLLRHGFAGRIVPINPARSEIRGVPAFARLSDVPDAVDVAILAVPADRLVAAVRECAAGGVGCCVIIATGFAEADAAGAALQAEIRMIARGAGMRILGPNCMGLINPHHAMALCSSVVLDIDRLIKGRIGLVSQSGAFMVSLLDRAYAEGIGFSVCASVGNQCDLEICDFLDYLFDDPGTDAIAVYAEGFADPARFVSSAARARDAGKPLVILKTGRTDDGIRAAQSHTASLAGSFEAFEAVCIAHGAVVVDDPVTLIRVADVLARGPHLRGDGIAVASGSGGGAGIMVDRLGTGGLRLARLSAATRAALGTFLLPPQADNPVDFGAQLPDRADDMAAPALAALCADPDVGAVVLYLTSMPFFEERTRRLAETAIASGKPALAFVLPGPAGERPRAVLREIGVACFESLEDLLCVLRSLVSHRRMQVETPRDAATRPPGVPAALPDFEASPAGVERLVASYGIPFAKTVRCADLDAARVAAAELGFPLVLKGIVDGVTHKTDLGLVKTGLADVADLERAWREIEESLASHGTEGVLLGAILQRQIAQGVELLAGIRRDPQFGPMIVAGAGGILVEWLRDVGCAPAPLSAAGARRLLRERRSAALLDGVRGSAPRDVEAAADVLVRLSWLAVDLGQRLVDLEINPLIVGPAGAGACAVDLRSTLSDGVTR